MSSDPPAAGARYFCHQCNRTVVISPPSSGELSCPRCSGGFLEEFDPPPPPPPTFALNPAATPFFPSSSPSPVFLSRSASFDLRNSNDLFSLINLPSPSQSLDSTAFNPFDFLQRYLQTLFNGGANIQIVLEGGGIGGDRLGGNIGDYFIGPGLEQLIQQLAENDPTRYGTPPAAKTAIASLPNVVISKDEVGSDEAQCAVCKDCFEIEEVVKKLPCNHMYHEYCILPWLELHNSCPVCRFELPTDDKDYEERKGVGDRRGAVESTSSVGSSGVVGGSEEESGSGQRSNPVERRFRISLPWPFRGLGNQGDGNSGGDAGGSNDGAPGTDNAGR